MYSFKMVIFHRVPWSQTILLGFGFGSFGTVIICVSFMGIEVRGRSAARYVGISFVPPKFAGVCVCVSICLCVCVDLYPQE